MNRRVDQHAPWISAYQVQARYGIYIQGLHNLVLDKAVKVRTNPGGWPSRLYSREDIEAYLKTKRRTSGSKPKGRRANAKVKVKA